MNFHKKTVVTVISKIGERKRKGKACLVVVYGDDLGKKMPIKDGKLLIGRSSQTHWQIDHESVSRRHAEINSSENVVEVSDLNSTNGTYLNDEMIEKARLKDGDLLKVGRTIFKFLASNNVEAAYHQEIFRLNTIDGLTRCFNASFFHNQMCRELSRAIRYERPLAIILLNITYFQELVEEYGQLASDALLTQLGKRLMRKIRRDDFLCRLRSSEFVLIAPETNRGQAQQLMQRIKDDVVSQPFVFEDVRIPIELRIGCATIVDLDSEEVTERLGSLEIEHSSSQDVLSGDCIEIGRKREFNKFSILKDKMLELADTDDVKD